MPTHNHLVCERSPVLGASLRIIQSRGIITIPCAINTGPTPSPDDGLVPYGLRKSPQFDCVATYIGHLRLFIYCRETPFGVA